LGKLRRSRVGKPGRLLVAKASRWRVAEMQEAAESKR
jgi:hypothetical protein